MKFFGINISRTKKPGSNFEVGTQLRPAEGQGPFTSAFKSYVPRKVETSFYEILREGIPIIDAAIWKLVDLDGHLVVTGNNEQLVDEIKEWMDNVQVNDLQKGLQAFHQNISNETFEQGFGLGEFLPDKSRSDIIQLKVADSKTIKFARKNGLIEIYQKADGDNDYRPLKTNNILYQSIHNENQNPYGTSIIRSMEFCGKLMATMHNSLLNVWERFGDPSFEITYKASKKGLGPEDLETRRKKIATEFDAAIRKKREGYSADFVRAIDKDSEITIKVIGGENEILELEVPARHVLEQIIAKTGLPSWMLGMHWSTTERLADKEVIMLQEARLNRHKAKLPVYTNLIKILLLLRGRTWKKGDWNLEFAKLNLFDLVAEAQARFLNLQGDYYLVQNAQAMGTTVDPAMLSSGKAYLSGDKDYGLRGRGDSRITLPTVSSHERTDTGECSCGKSHEGGKELHRPFQWPELDKQEQEYEAELKYEWGELQKQIFTILKLQDDVPLPPLKVRGGAEGGGVKAPPEGIPPINVFTFSDEQRSQIMISLKNWLGIFDPSTEDSPVTWYYGQAYSLGLIQAANMIGEERPILDIIKNREIFNELRDNGFAKLKDRATIAIKNKILPEIEGQVLVGTNPTHVARMLENRFGAANADWERLARTELAISAETAKLNEWKENDIDTSDAPIPGLDTHPRCRCANSVKKISGKWVTVFVPAPDACAVCLSLVTR